MKILGWVLFSLGVSVLVGSIVVVGLTPTVPGKGGFVILAFLLFLILAYTGEKLVKKARDKQIV